MTDQPTSKIIQITNNEHEVMALCEDGSIWVKNVRYGRDARDWCCFLEGKPIHEIAQDQIIYELAKSLMELTEQYTATGTRKVLHFCESPILGELGLLKTRTTHNGKDDSWTLNWKTLERFKEVKDE